MLEDSLKTIAASPLDRTQLILGFRRRFASASAGLEFLNRLEDAKGMRRTEKPIMLSEIARRILKLESEGAKKQTDEGSLATFLSVNRAEFEKAAAPAVSGVVVNEAAATQQPSIL